MTRPSTCTTSCCRSRPPPWRRTSPPLRLFCASSWPPNPPRPHTRRSLSAWVVMPSELITAADTCSHVGQCWRWAQTRRCDAEPLLLPPPTTCTNGCPARTDGDYNWFISIHHNCGRLATIVCGADIGATARVLLQCTDDTATEMLDVQHSAFRSSFTRDSSLPVSTTTRRTLPCRPRSQQHSRCSSPTPRATTTCAWRLPCLTPTPMLMHAVPLWTRPPTHVCRPTRSSRTVSRRRPQPNRGPALHRPAALTARSAPVKRKADTAIVLNKRIKRKTAA